MAATGDYFSICVESKSLEPIYESLVKLDIANIFGELALQNIYTMQGIKPTPFHLQTWNSWGECGEGKDKSCSPTKMKILQDGSRFRLIEMSYPAFVCNVIHASLPRHE